MEFFYESYNITPGHSTSYYPQGNGSVESSNKSLITIIKNILQENKNTWHTKLTFALWVDCVSTKRALGMSPFELVYGTNVFFPTYLGISVMKLLQDHEK